jgi:hypothetical protein
MPTTHVFAGPQVEHLSLSRVRRRAQCARMDWWQTEGARDGYRRDASPTARTAYALKKLTSLPAVVGDAVHHAAATRARCLRDGLRPPSLDEMRATVRERLNAAVTSRNVERFLARPSHTPMLREVFHNEWPGGRIPADVVDETRAKVESLLRVMMVHPVWADLAHCGRGDIVVCDALDALEIEVNGAPVRVYAAPDLVWISHEPQYVPGFGVPLLPPVVTILDWKTGRPSAAEEQARTQLAVYAWWVREKLALPVTPAAFIGRVANLGASHAEDIDCRFVLYPEDVARGRRIIGDAGAAIIASRHADGTLPMEEAPRSLTACRWCAFTSICADASTVSEQAQGGADA